MSAVSALPLFALVLLSCGGAPIGQADPQRQDAVIMEASQARDGAVEARIRAAFALPADRAIRQQTRSADAVRPMVRDRVSARLLAGAIDLRAQDYFFTPPDGLQRHLGVLTTQYADLKTARMRAGLIAKQGYFERSKILTPMASRQNGAAVLVFYTETGADSKLRGLLTALAGKSTNDRQTP